MRANARRFRFAFVVLGICIALCAVLQQQNAAIASAEPGTDLIESAMFTRGEFFGAQALIPLPTAQARENLVRLSIQFPERAKVFEKLAEAEEKLGNFDAAEKALVRHSELDKGKIERLAEFYHRRARFSDEANLLRQMLSKASAEARPALFERLFDLARKHDLPQFKSAQFLREVANENSGVFEVFVRIIDRLEIEKDGDAALEFLRHTKQSFPARSSELLEREIEILTSLNRGDEAERVYNAAFDPFWRDERADAFYGFLSDRDRLREYGSEFKAKFKADPADFDTAIRYAHYRAHNYEEITPVMLKLENAKTAWSADELLIVARLLIRDNNGDLASRFLYTLYNRFLSESRRVGIATGLLGAESRKELRAKVLYQLFEIFSDAGDQKLSLTKGDLKFYDDIARTDTNPGIATGILSLLFADANVGREFETRETTANKYFNRAAAYRLFLAYRQENPASPQLAQMHLDIVRLYTATGEVDIAEKTLREFLANYKDAADFTSSAYKLADAFNSLERYGDARSIYRELLDHLGSKPDGVIAESAADENRNLGINIPVREPKNDYAAVMPRFRDHLGKAESAVTYREVLTKYVDSLNREKKTGEILEILSAEIRTYPDAEWLYELRLAWLEKTNLTDDQLAAYREALDRFQSDTWRDKLARWFVRQRRQDEFSRFSAEVVATLDDEPVKEYLAEFADSKSNFAGFDGQLRRQLYLAAHQRFPHNPVFVTGLLHIYAANKQEPEWRRLAAENYFAMKDVRELFLNRLAETGELRGYVSKAAGESAVYRLFRADAAIRLSNYEQAIATYRELKTDYPNSPEFTEPLIALTRSFGQKDQQLLSEATKIAKSVADQTPSDADARTRSGELFAELGDYSRSRDEWEKLAATAAGDRETYLNTATIYWDYFQYEDALRTITAMRRKFGDHSLSAFEAGAIREYLHDMPAAIGEYVAALGDEDQKERAIKRLATLANRDGMAEKIDAAFEAERARMSDSSSLSLSYAELLSKIKKPDHAEKVLSHAASVSRDEEFLKSVQYFFADIGNLGGEQMALERLAETAASPRRKIRYSLDLAESFRESRKRESAKAVLDRLIHAFPANIGAIIETSNFYNRLGFENDAIKVLENAVNRSSGKHRSGLARRLSRRLVQAGRLEFAERLLAEMHKTGKHDISLFRELADVCVRRGNADLLRTAFNETLAELRTSNAGRRELDAAISDLRVSMIDAFKRLGDHASSIEQHMELINRDAENDSLTDNAIAYVKRYGGGDTLLEYYRKTSAESFKNYRWSVVLARIYDANGDVGNALKCYRAAIVNQPEMVELYLAAADLEARNGNYESAIRDLDTVLELSNDEPVFVKKKIELLKKAGRMAAVDAEMAKLPAVGKPVKKTDLGAALELDRSRNVEAINAFRSAFDALVQQPLDAEFTAAGINGYVNAVRREEPVDKIFGRLWKLRERLTSIAEEPNSTHAGEARKRISTLDAAVVESVGAILKTVATDEELAAVHNSLMEKIAASSAVSNRDGALAFVHDLSRRADLGSVEEAVLLKKLHEVGALIDRQNVVRELVEFYNKRGAFENALAILEKSGGEPRAIAGQARLAGMVEKEIVTLQALYDKPRDLPMIEPDNDVARFLELLYKTDRDRLTALAGGSSPFQIQLINFLIAKGEKELAHSAIESSGRAAAWKLARHAETSLALREFDSTAECYFCEALQFETIGSMIEQEPDKARYLVGDDWFTLTREYGEWLQKSPHRAEKPSRYLAAMTEKLPRSAAEQTKLGRFYLSEGKADAAAGHLRLAVELAPNDTEALTGLGVGYFRSGKKDLAKEMWLRAIADADPQNLLTFFNAANDLDASVEARQMLAGPIVEFLKTNNADDSPDFQELVRAVADSFADGRKKAAYFETILQLRPTDTSLAAMLLDKSLIDLSLADPFFRRLIEADDSDAMYGIDYEFASVAQRAWSRDDAESIYDHQTGFKPPEPDDARIEWQAKYLRSLIEREENAGAEQLCDRIEKDLSRRYARPAWLRLARIRLSLRSGKFDLADAERFTGISVSESASEITPPNVERFNDLLRVMNDEGYDTLTFSAGFFARQIAFGNHEPVNFAELSRVFFRQNKNADALKLLDLMVRLNNENLRDWAMAEIASFDLIKKFAIDAARTGDTQNHSDVFRPDGLETAAQIAAEFDQNDAAREFRRALLETSPHNYQNKLELARLTAAGGAREEAAVLLNQIIDSREAERSVRWQAKWQMRQLVPGTETGDIRFDAYSQFYLGLIERDAGRNNPATAFFTNSLMAGDEAALPAKEELIRMYVVGEKYAAAFELAESGNFRNPDEMCHLLSQAAKKTGEFGKALAFEKQRSSGGDPERMSELNRLQARSRQRATEMVVDLNNTRKL